MLARLEAPDCECARAATKLGPGQRGGNKKEAAGKARNKKNKGDAAIIEIATTYRALSPIVDLQIDVRAAGDANDDDGDESKPLYCFHREPKYQQMAMKPSHRTNTYSVESTSGLLLLKYFGPLVTYRRQALLYSRFIGPEEIQLTTSSLSSILRLLPQSQQERPLEAV